MQRSIEESPESESSCIEASSWQEVGPKQKKRISSQPITKKPVKDKTNNTSIQC